MNMFHCRKVAAPRMVQFLVPRRYRKKKNGQRCQLPHEIPWVLFDDVHSRVSVLSEARVANGALDERNDHMERC